jgi:hypothetical protein
MATYDYYVFSKILAIAVTCIFAISLIIAIRAIIIIKKGKKDNFTLKVNGEKIKW